jgi:hypothetical protein
MTAVEWLLNELEKYHYPTDAMIMYAKAIEKKQLNNAYEEGYNRVAKLIEEATKLNLEKD